MKIFPSSNFLLILETLPKTKVKCIRPKIKKNKYHLIPRNFL